MKKLSIVVVASLAIACSAAENRKIDEVQYKNHRPSTNDTKTSSAVHKYPVYPAQVYANLSNVKDFTSAKPADKSAIKATEAVALQDVVRVFMTPATERKRKHQDHQPVASTTPAPIASSSSKTSSSSSSSSSPSVYLVTAKSAATIKDKKSYSRPPSTLSDFNKETADSPTTTRTTAVVAEDESRRVRYSNGTKARRVLRTQNPASTAQQHLLYAATTPPPTVASYGARDAFAATTRVNSSNASKPFTTVLVPKQMLDGDLVQRGDYSSSFRPIAPPPTFSYKQNVDTNSVENRRASNAVRTQATSASHPKPSAAGHAFAARQPATTYKVEEFVGGNDQSLIVADGGYGFNNNKQDRADQSYVPPADKFRQEPAQKFDNPPRQEVLVKYDSLKYEVPKYSVPQQEAPNYNVPNYEIPKHHGAPKHDVPRQGLKYGVSAPETVKYEQQQHKNVHTTDRFREFYPATEIPPKDVMSYPPYNSAGKFNAHSSPIETAGPSVEWDKSHGTHKEFTSPPTRYAPINSDTESNGPEFVLGDVNPKYVLKTILRDMLKSKQQSEVKSGPSTTMDEIIDSYFKTNRPNVDFSLDNYDIETDMSCNLRSLKHITDGQCVTTKPVVEAVCADRCLVLASSQPFSSMRQRSSPLANQQVEALHCVDGDVKLKRVQLHCRDGNTVNNVVKVVINCRCKLHQIQPQMRSNSSPGRQLSPTVNPDIMHIAAGKF